MSLYSKLYVNNIPSVSFAHMPVFDTARMGMLHTRRQDHLEAIAVIDDELARLKKLEQHKVFSTFKRMIEEDAIARYQRKQSHQQTFGLVDMDEPCTSLEGA